MRVVEHLGGKHRRGVLQIVEAGAMLDGAAETFGVAADLPTRLAKGHRLHLPAIFDRPRGARCGEIDLQGVDAQSRGQGAGYGVVQLDEIIGGQEGAVALKVL